MSEFTRRLTSELRPALEAATSYTCRCSKKHCRRLLQHPLVLLPGLIWILLKKCILDYGAWLGRRRGTVSLTAISLQDGVL
jgi:hypothetical protein